MYGLHGYYRVVTWTSQPVYESLDQGHRQFSRSWLYSRQSAFLKLVHLAMLGEQHLPVGGEESSINEKA